MDLTKQEQYWKERMKEGGTNAVNFMNKPCTDELIEDMHRKRIRRVREELDMSDLANMVVVEWGCGTGSMCRAFHCWRYTGVDLMPEFVDEAKRRFPSYDFTTIDEFEGNNNGPLIDMFFTCTCLQHNSDVDVVRIFKSWKNELIAFNANKLHLLFYENTSMGQTDRDFMNFRTHLSYHRLINRVFKQARLESLQHFLDHGEDHCLMRWEVTNPAL